MTRGETTKFLSDLLEYKYLSGAIGKYWAKEVPIDYGTALVRRVDYLQFDPQNIMSIGGIEQGVFICYEVKSCIEDVMSGNGLNFIGDKNYIVTTMETWKAMIPRLHDGAIEELYKQEHEAGGFCNFSEVAVKIAIPKGRKGEDEFMEPTPLDGENYMDWTFETLREDGIYRSYGRRRSATELLFLMLRSRMKS